MTEWWTYGLSDFLMFSPQAYWRLIARYNAAWWPGQLLASSAGIAIVLLPARKPRWTLLVLAAAWAWVGWAFAWQRYAEIFLAAGWLAAACGVQALMLAAAAALPVDSQPSGTHRHIGVAIVILALLCPLLSPVSGHTWAEAEVFGFMPDPTALATVGALVALRGWPRLVLGVVPVLVLLLGLATRWLLA
jgi:hypothetical protein